MSESIEASRHSSRLEGVNSRDTGVARDSDDDCAERGYGEKYDAPTLTPLRKLSQLIAGGTGGGGDGQGNFPT